METLITGGNGLLGHHLIAALQERGDRVRVLALPTEDTTRLEERNVAIYRGDIREPETLIAPMRRVGGPTPSSAAMASRYCRWVTGSSLTRR